MGLACVPRADRRRLPGPAGIWLADALGGPTQLEIIERAGHRMWLDRADIIDKAATFLASA